MPILQVRSRLQYYRLRLGLSQEELAQKTQKHLFCLGIEYRRELSLCSISPRIRHEFQRRGFCIAPKSRLVLKETKKKWSIQKTRYILELLENRIEVYDTGIHPMTISRNERNIIQCPHPATMQKLALAVGEPLYKVFPPVKFR